MVQLAHLLGVGYFPREFPPAFSSKSYARVIDAHLTSLPTSFNSPPTAKLEIFRLSRVGRIPRRLGIPNPILYFGLCQEIVDNWTQFQAHTQRSLLSQSKPKPGRATERAIIAQPFQEGQLLRVKSMAKARYLLLADVSQCYSSLYTHSIPWALNTKAVAKSRRSDSNLLGNELDKRVRACQDGQTKGIPIGPDTSFLISEIILSAVDSRLGQIQGSRYFDNYELCFPTRQEADAALNNLEQQLAEYELFLNPDKTAIMQLPVPLIDTWVSDLGNHLIQSNRPGRQFGQLITYFSRAFELVHQYPTAPILQYAIYKTTHISIDSDNWKLYQALLFQSVMSDPGTLPYVAHELLHYSRGLGYSIDRAALGEVLNAQFEFQNLLKNESAAAWAIWLAIALQIPIHPNAATQISSTENSIIALLALDARQKGIIAASELDVTNWEMYITSSDLYGEHWLLAYEANVQGWLHSPSGDYVDSDNSFGYLKNMGVRFYDTSPISSLSLSNLVPPPFETYFMFPWS